jgi:uncharacterized membrane protein (UPF0182 family)
MQNENSGKPWRGRVLVILLLLVGAIGLIVLLSMLAIDYLVDVYWFESLGYGFYYLQRKLYRYAVFAGVVALFFAIFFLNLRIAGRLLASPEKIATAAGGRPHRQRLLDRFRTGATLLYGGIALVLGILVALPAFHSWEKFLFFIFGPSSGVADPFFGRDISFYLFRYPVYTLLQEWLLIAFAVLLACVVIIYAMDSGFLTNYRRLSKGARYHLGALVMILILIVIWDFALQRYALVYDSSNLPTFSGPGYVQMHVTLPLIWATMILLAAVPLSLLVTLYTRRGKWVTIGLAAGLGLVLLLRGTDFPHRIVADYVVKPNQLSKEAPYIARNIEATLDAYRLNDVEMRDFIHERFPTDAPAREVQEMLRNIPVWDEETLEAVFQQLQELRAYYIFPPVSVARYSVNDRYHQVFLAPREIDYDNLPGSAQNWTNRRLTYTHGYGTVMVPASQDGGSPMTWFVRGVPPVAEYGLETRQPRVYFGLGAYDYVIAPNSSGELDYPQGNDNVMYTYEGNTGGVPIGSLFKKFIYAYYFKDKNIFFTTKTTRESKILYRRNILERVRHLLPYLRLDETPYSVQTPSGIYWFIDAYTTSTYYPAAAPYLTPDTDYNYIRNSVKIVVNAFDGSVDFYVYDETDPIVQAYQRMYPGFFKNKEDMPQELTAHVRYPKDIFNVQMRIYARYHQTDPSVFYQQEDLWTFADTIIDDRVVPFQPYYLTLNLIEEQRPDFLLLLPMMPRGRNNLSALALAGSDPPHYGRIVIYNFPKGELVYGPEQINAIINQDPEIAEMFTLWDQSGSSVRRGKMIILPFENSVLFIQPVYLIARSAIKIPELQRLIMSEGQVAVIESSLDAAYAKLQERIDAERQQLRRRYPGRAPVEGVPQATEQPTGPAESDSAPVERPKEPIEEPGGRNDGPPQEPGGLNERPADAPERAPASDEEQ